MNATKSRKSVKPVSGTVSLVRPVGTVNALTGEISISGKGYYLIPFNGGYRLHGWDAKRQQPTVYDLTADLSSCDCPDATCRSEREGGCKHRKALQALKAAGKI